MGQFVCSCWNYLILSLSLDASSVRYSLYFDYPELNPRIGLVDELIRHDADAPVVVLDGLGLLQTIEYHLQCVVEVV